MMSNDIVRCLVSPVILGLVLACQACGSREGGRMPDGDPSSKTAVGDYSIKAYLQGEDGDSRLVRFRAADDPAWLPARANSTSSTSSQSPGVSEAEEVRVVREKIRGDFPVEDNEGNIEVVERDFQGTSLEDDNSVWQLLHLTVRACISEHESDVLSPSSSVFSQPWGPPYGDGTVRRWYMYLANALGHGDIPYGGEGTVPRIGSCDRRLHIMENLVCAADKLLEVADTVRPLEWRFEWGEESRAMVIPAQDPRDKFIVRDLAINVLAHLAMLGRDPQGVGHGGKSCSVLYDNTLEDASLFDGSNEVHVRDTLLESSQAGGSASYPTEGLIINPQNARQIIEARLQMVAHINRVGARLLKTALQSSLEADIAGAEHLKAAAGDPLLGAQLLWGASGHPGAPFNSMRHALRLLYGRWELNTNASPPFPSPNAVPLFDPECGGYRAMSELPVLERAPGDPADLMDAIGPGFSARWNARPPKTSEESLALSLVEPAGIVLKPEVLTPEAHASVATAVIEQLQRDSARASGVALDDPVALSDFGDSILGQGVAQVVDGISPEALRYALRHNFETYRLLSGRSQGDESMLTEGDQGGMTLADEEAAPQVLGIGGIVIAGGLPTSDLTADPFAEIAGAAAASVCQFRRDFQDVISIAANFRLNLEGIKGVAQVRDIPTVREIAQGATEEVVSWAGKTVASMQDPSGPSPNRLVTLTNLPLEELGVSAPEDAPDMIRLVHGRPWVAQCAAGVRRACPSELPSEAVYVPELLSALESAPGHVTVSILFHPPEDAPQRDNHGMQSDEYFFLIGMTPGGTGKVLAVFPFRDGVAVHHLSPYRREMTRRIFGLSEASPVTDECGNSISGGYQPASYCILGMDRDSFVPLANELTSESGVNEDSWKHYLRLAEESAHRADELGRQIIDLGLERDLRREGAQEELAGICGSFAAVPDLSFSSGSFELSSDDRELNACLQEPLVDVVYFAQAKPGETARADLDEAYCNGSETGGLCSGALPSVAGLGFDVVGGGVDISQQGGSGDCRDAAALMENAYEHPRFNRTLMDRLATAPMLNGSRSSAILRRYKLREYNDASWDLLLNGAPLMSARPVPATEPGELGALAEYPTCLHLPESWACHSEPDGCCSEVAQRVLGIFGAAPAMSLGIPGNELRETLQSALWTLGQVAGRVPAGTFELHLPVVNFSREVQDPLLPDYEVHPAAIYGWSAFIELDPGQGEPLYRLSPGSQVHEGDVARLGSLRRATSEYAAARALSFDGELFAQIQDSVGPEPERFLVIPAANREIRLDNGGVSDRLWLSNLGRRIWMEDGHSRAWDGYRFSGWENRFLGSGGMRGYLFVGNREPNAGEQRFGDIYPDSFGKDVERWGRVLGGPCMGNAIPHTCAWSTDRVNATQRDWHAYSFDGSGWGGGPGERSNFTLEILSPRITPPSDRVALFVNRHHALPGRAVASAAALACLAEGAALPTIGEPPPVTSIEDMAVLKKWMEQQGDAVADAQRSMFVVEVPQRVVDYFVGDIVPYGTVGQGARGSQILAMAKALQDAHDGFGRIASGFRQMAAGIDSAHIGLDSADIRNKQEIAAIAFQKVDVSRQVALAQLGTVSGLAGGLTPSPFSSPLSGVLDAAVQAAVQAVNLNAAMQQEDILGQRKILAGEAHAHEVARVLTDLDKATGDAAEIIQGGVAQVRAAVLTVLQTQNALQQSAAEASFELARAVGADFAEINGRVVEMPVNVVYRRQYDVLQRRYKQALDGAKRYAYLARLSLEQRLGVRVANLNERIGPLEAPSTWIDDVCSLQGVDYQALRRVDATGKAIVGDSSVSEEDVVKGFADRYIGDYVAKLREFVEFYNVQYPFREADDVAVLSVRGDFLAGAGACSREAQNLLYHSDSLYESSLETSDALPDGSFGGWRRTKCDALGCLQVSPGEYLAIDGGSELEMVVPIPPPGDDGGVSLLRLMSPAGELTLEEIEQARPPGIVYQSVQLQAGVRYRLSWWSMARATDGKVDGGTMPYRAAVYDEAWGVVGLLGGVANGGTEWDDRQVLEFVAHRSGFFHVSFEPEDSGGSLALANVQLAVVTGNGELTDVYERTTGRRDNVWGPCGAEDSEKFRGAFTRRCNESGACFYELTRAISLSSKDLAGKGRLLPGISAGNYNYRHVGVALNVVGTGVLDCSGSSVGCYASGFVEYDLSHSAFNTPVTDYGGDSQCFSFGRGAIRRGKALAAERFIGVPLGSADAGMIERQEFMKPEFHGRPLTGSYTLRIYDSPALRWERLEDIQLVLKHRYWSRVERSPSF